jgi:hypothetical protein
MITSPHELPGYGQALEQERIQRLLAFHPMRYRIGGFEVTAMTLRQHSLLRLVNSPLLPPFETPEPQQLIQFLWIMSPHFTRGESAEKSAFFARARQLYIPPPPPRWRNRLLQLRWYYQRKGCELRESETLREAREFVQATFADRPEGGTEDLAEYYSDEASIIGTLAAKYHFLPEQTMETPLTAIFQHLKRIHESQCLEHGLPVLLNNPSDDVVQRHLAEVNSQN